MCYLQPLKWETAWHPYCTLIYFYPQNNKHISSKWENIFLCFTTPLYTTVTYTKEYIRLKWLTTIKKFLWCFSSKPLNKLGARRHVCVLLALWHRGAIRFRGGKSEETPRRQTRCLLCHNYRTQLTLSVLMSNGNMEFISTPILFNGRLYNLFTDRRNIQFRQVVGLDK